MATNKTHWKNLANYDYLGAYSLEGITNEIVLTILELKKQRVVAAGGVSEECMVAYFKEENVDGVVVKPMVFNKTNCKTMEKIYGPYIEDWKEKQVTIFVTTTQFQRDRVQCLRIKDTSAAPKTTQVQTEPQHTCEICGKAIDTRTYNVVMKNYGVSVCSKACYDKHLENNKEDKGE